MLEIKLLKNKVKQFSLVLPYFCQKVLLKVFRV